MTEDVLGGFSGAGGWDVHDKELGLTTQSLELDPAACDTARAAGHNVTQVDITDYSLSASHPYTGAKFSPPCTPFTVAGNGDGRRLRAEIVAAVPRVTAAGIPGSLVAQHPEAALVLEPLRWVWEAARTGRLFRWVVLEQTREVLPIWEAYATMMERLGYSVAVGNLHAEQYGVPQTRTRAVLIASLDREVSLPTPTHTRYRTGHVKVSGMPYTDLDRKPWVPMAQALNINSPAPGAYLRSNYGTGGVAANRGKRTLYQPAPTVTRKYNRNKWMLNGEVLGALTERQASLLQTFPADYPWQGRADERQLQLGNAIPPLLAKAILQQVI